MIFKIFYPGADLSVTRSYYAATLTEAFRVLCLICEFKRIALPKFDDFALCLFNDEYIHPCDHMLVVYREKRDP